MTSGIYAIINKANGKKYIGSSVDIEDRWKRHAARLRKGNHHSPHLQHAWDLYGQDNFEFIVLLKCKQNELIDLEQEQIDIIKPEYNVSPTAGRVAGVIRTEEYRRKQSVSQSGKTISEETRNKISIGMRGKRNSLGVIKTEETKRKQSEKLKGRQLRLGTKASEDTKQKMRNSQKNRREKEKGKRDSS